MSRKEGYDVITGWVLGDTRDGGMMQQKKRGGEMAGRRGERGVRRVRSEAQSQFCSQLHSGQDKSETHTIGHVLISLI